MNQNYNNACNYKDMTPKDKWLILIKTLNTFLFNNLFTNGLID